ncbi:MAG: hypothetical protein EOO43_00655 [Flavobacterium sp.]|nr:MAG: hypothetical protein EOO43_00655 [Flavobacterium sp.]
MFRIRLAFKNFPEAYSSPFIRYFEGYKYHEVAQEMDLPPGTLETRIHAARKQIQRRLQV